MNTLGETVVVLPLMQQLSITSLFSTHKKTRINSIKFICLVLIISWSHVLSMIQKQFTSYEWFYQTYSGTLMKNM